jgi:hypothetical protein
MEATQKLEIIKEQLAAFQEYFKEDQQICTVRMNEFERMMPQEQQRRKHELDFHECLGLVLGKFVQKLESVIKFIEKE